MSASAGAADPAAPGPAEPAPSAPGPAELAPSPAGAASSEPAPDGAGGHPPGQSRHAQYGEHWGEGAARCFSLESDILDEDHAVRLMPVPDNFLCPISAAIMVDPVATVDGCVYERQYIERWFRERRQQGQRITSPVTGLELPSATLMPLVALQRAIEAYLAHRPELKREHMAGRSFEEAAQILQTDLFEKQTVHATTQDKLRRLKQANKALERALQEAEARISLLEGERPPPDATPRGAGGARCGACGGPACAKEAHAILGRSGGGRLAVMVLSLVLLAAAALALRARLPSAGHGPALPPLGPPAPVALGAALGAAAPPAAPPAAVPLAGRRAEAEDRRLAAAGPGASGLGAGGLAAGPPGAAAGGPAAGAAAAGGQGAGALGAGRGAGGRGAGVGGEPGRGGGAAGASQANPAFAGQLDHLRTGSPEEKQRAAFMLRIFASEHAENQAAIARAGAIAPLIALLQEGSPALREEAARALWNLARNREEINMSNQQAIGRAGAIRPLVSLLEDEVPRVRIVAAAVLNDLATDNMENQVAVAKAGAIGPLVRLLQDEEAPAVVMAASLLKSLAAGSGEGDVDVAMALAGAVPPLVALLRADSLLAQEQAASALGVLAGYSPAIQEAIARAGAIDALVERLRGDLMRGTTALALRNLAAGSPSNQEAIVRAGAIAPLVQLLEDGMPGVREEAACALWNLAMNNSDNQVAIVRSGAAIPLIALLKGDAQEQATLTLMSLDANK